MAKSISASGEAAFQKRKNIRTVTEKGAFMQHFDEQVVFPVSRRASRYAIPLLWKHCRRRRGEFRELTPREAGPSYVALIEAARSGDTERIKCALMPFAGYGFETEKVFKNIAPLGHSLKIVEVPCQDSTAANAAPVGKPKRPRRSAVRSVKPESPTE